MLSSSDAEEGSERFEVSNGGPVGSACVQKQILKNKLGEVMSEMCCMTLAFRIGMRAAELDCWQPVLFQGIF